MKAFQFNEKESQITDEKVFWNRRDFIQKAGIFVGSGLISANVLGQSENEEGTKQDELIKQKKAQFFTNQISGKDLKSELTSEYAVTHHNNFYEFSLDKKEPSELAKNFNPDLSWQVKIGGEVEKSGIYTLEDILKRVSQEERIYRLRCVEAWSMVVPWYGFQLGHLIAALKPNSNARYVEFKTLHDSKQFPGQKRGTFGSFSLPWPYTEGLTIAEAMNPLTFMATGVYGKSLPGQNGAPLRLVVPWKYGFKSIKSIVAINFTKEQPVSTWNQRLPQEYGFYANVNPDVDHPRWSQASERRITNESFWGVKKIKTLMFNGYGDLVGNLYKGLDLKKNY